MFLAQNAFHAGPIAASQTALVMVDPLASLAIGIGLFGDDLRTSGAVRAARGPLAPRHVHRRGLRWPSHRSSRACSGQDDRFAELLSTRSRSERLAEHVQGQLQ